MGQILSKTFFLLKLSYILPDYTFLLFLNIFGLIHWKLLFLVKKVTISERITEILRKFVFLIGENQEENLDLFKQLFLIKPVKLDKY